jgi:hypothetical protein
MKTARIIAPAGVLAAAALALTGCAAATPIIHGETLKPTPTTSATPSTPATAALPALTSAGAVPLTCADMAPEMARDWTATTTPPAAGSIAASIVAAGGIACSYQNSAAQPLEVAMLQPTEVTKTALSAYFAAGYGTVPQAGNAAWFRTVGGVGDGEAFAGTTWISIVSTNLQSASDVQNLVTDLAGMLPSG